MTPSEPLIKFLVPSVAFPKSIFNLVASDDDTAVTFVEILALVDVKEPLILVFKVESLR